MPYSQNGNNAVGAQLSSWLRPALALTREQAVARGLIAAKPQARPVPQGTGNGVGSQLSSFIRPALAMTKNQAMARGLVSPRMQAQPIGNSIGRPPLSARLKPQTRMPAPSLWSRLQTGVGRFTHANINALNNARHSLRNIAVNYKNDLSRTSPLLASNSGIARNNGGMFR